MIINSSDNSKVVTYIEVGKYVSKPKTGIILSEANAKDIAAYQTAKAASELAAEQVAAQASIDKALNEFGFKMGPFQMADLAGLDLGWSKGIPTGNPIKDALCEAGRRGQKTGKGYYDYDSNRMPTLSIETEKIIVDLTGAQNSIMANEQIIETLICPMINEALKILDENKAQRPSDVDVVWLYGYGWPRDKGGPLYYGDKVGAKKVLEVMERLAITDKDLKVAELLYKCSEKNLKFLDIDTGGLIAN